MVNLWKRAGLPAIVLVLLLAGPLAPAASAQGVKTGLLTCNVAAGFGWLIGSTRTMDCKYAPGSGHTEDYTGTISKVGLDLGYLGACAIVWAVVAPNSSPGPGALSGNYFGASVQAAAMVGGGVNVMLGGFRNSIALQPVSIMGNTGIYLGAGISSMSLEFVDY
jgi:hypothetical protein